MKEKVSRGPGATPAAVGRLRLAGAQDARLSASPFADRHACLLSTPPRELENWIDLRDFVMTATEQHRVTALS